MPYVSNLDRDQLMVCSWDSFVALDSVARLIDAFVDSLDPEKYGIKPPANEGRPAYNPRALYKLYIYGNRTGIRSSRKLANSCRVNIEVKWMIGGVEPDFRTISDFRKDHIENMMDIFHEFNRRLSGEVEWGFTSIDGSKFQANNSKDNNFTKDKLDDRIQWLDDRTKEYMAILDEMDENDDAEESPGMLTREEVDAKLAAAKKRLSLYQSYQKLMEETGATQLSITDADARLMKSKDGFTVSYNPQTAVDSETHLIRDINMTNQVTDHGMIGSTMEGIRNETAPDEILEVVADKGYADTKDIVNCLESGIIPNVTKQDEKEYTLEIDYKESETTDPTSTNAEDISKCLHAGEVPDAYKDVISDMEVVEVRRRVNEESNEETPKSPYGTSEEMLERAAKGYYPHLFIIRTFS